MAVLYSSVGHGGASGYLAVLSFILVSPAEMSTTALLLNLLVAGMAVISFFRAGHLSFQLAWPFVVSSVPTAFAGGLLRVSDQTYFLLLAPVLVVAAFRLMISPTLPKSEIPTQRPRLSVAVPSGAGIGLLSGIVGVGGGIFLSPLLLLMKWADPKQTSAVSALFIVVNSLAGLGGRLARGALEGGLLLPLIVAAFFGGLVGSHFGATRFSAYTLRRLLAIVLLVAALKLVYTIFA